MLRTTAPRAAALYVLLLTASTAPASASAPAAPSSATPPSAAGPACAVTALRQAYVSPPIARAGRASNITTEFELSAACGGAAPPALTAALALPALAHRPRGMDVDLF